jgi:hypothetical protein
MKMQLIKELWRYNDSAAAAKWARRLNVAMEYLPSALQVYMISEPEVLVVNFVTLQYYLQIFRC